jgi:hypothetical protein
MVEQSPYWHSFIVISSAIRHSQQTLFSITVMINWTELACQLCFFSPTHLLHSLYDPVPMGYCYIFNELKGKALEMFCQGFYNVMITEYTEISISTLKWWQSNRLIGTVSLLYLQWTEEDALKLFCQDFCNVMITEYTEISISTLRWWQSDHLIDTVL